MKTDNELKKDLLSQFRNQITLCPDVQADDIEVSVMNGIVTLKGSVTSYEDKLAILKAVRGEQGVLAWDDGIVVQTPEEQHRTDAEIAAAARDAIKTITTVSLDTIEISVNEGWLTLAGTVEHLCQKESAEYAVTGLTGLAGVLNLITVKQ